MLFFFLPFLVVVAQPLNYTFIFAVSQSGLVYLHRRVLIHYFFIGGELGDSTLICLMIFGGWLDSTFMCWIMLSGFWYDW